MVFPPLLGGGGIRVPVAGPLGGGAPGPLMMFAIKTFLLQMKGYGPRRGTAPASGWSTEVKQELAVPPSWIEALAKCQLLDAPDDEILELQPLHNIQRRLLSEILKKPEQ